MLACPNCGGQMKFNIPTQDLYCEYCGTHMDPYSYEEGKNAKEEKTFDTTVFICPQCGGEIIGEDTSAAEFCSFCGASTVLESRISRERRPKYIIPFQKTKDECKEAYSKHVKKAVFAPKELRDAKYINSFRGIYIPYWAYFIDQKAQVAMPGSTTYRSGNYRCTDHYTLNFDLNAYYKGLSYDASSSFDDSISAGIAPYDVRGMKEFVPSILSGFYADTSDVDCNIYIEDAMSIADGDTLKQIELQHEFNGITPETPPTITGLNYIFGTQCQAIDSTLYPVWFMSYRKGDRVAYAVVNGQTGKVTADLPVDTSKYVLISLIAAIPLFLLLNFLPTIIPSALITIASFFAVITQFTYASELRKITAKEQRTTDKGYLSKHGRMDSYDSSNEKIKIKKRTKSSKGGFASTVIIIIVAIQIFVATRSSVSSLFTSVWAQLAVTVFSGLSMSSCLKTQKKTFSNNGAPVFVFSFAAVVIGLAIRIFKPVSDIYYYASALLILATVVMTNIGIIGRHNILTTRPLPQFNRHGGDDRA